MPQPEYLIHAVSLDGRPSHVIDGASGEQQLHDRTWWRDQATYTVEVVTPK